MKKKHVSEEAVVYIKKHAKELVQEFADPSIVLPDDAPTSVFMAGSPGAGKTEFSKSFLLEALWEGDRNRVVRIDQYIDCQYSDRESLRKALR